MEQNTEQNIEQTAIIRFRIRLGGRIQSCGFRNFCWKCAQKAHVTGWVSNDDQDYTRVDMEVQGTKSQIDDFLGRVYRGNGWSKITAMDRKQIPCIANEAQFQVLR